ncbi:PEPxxWA-CTERM sorting domain-containing protein [Sphingomonas sp. AP4-R1]|uniref:PEPxxWA-CTERM sorting domain-containing protein n=1 Tax=Sphingomonas sp. AP4-R1 TaxID=2735134 RepID=UPI0020A4F835|nr:PEPxxWA-CTERM sorting domain-containing protein [Sphingomonas sp. AP4-R1]
MRFALLAAGLAFSLTASAEAATILNFDSVRGRDGDTGYVSGPYREQGYTLTSNSCSTPQNTCFVTTGTSLTSLDRVGAALTNYHGGARTTVTKDDGSAFLLKSVDMANNYGDGFGVSPYRTNTVVFTFNFADGSNLTQNYTINVDAGQWLTVNTLTFDLAPLVSFSWVPTTNTSGFIQFDNLTLDTAAPVPESSTWAMMIAGFGLTGAAMRRRRRSIAFT